MSDRGQAFHLVEAARGLQWMGCFSLMEAGCLVIVQSCVERPPPHGGHASASASPLSVRQAEHHRVTDNEDLIKEMEHSTRPG